METHVFTTTVEQSKELLRLGLNPNTADLHSSDISVAHPEYPENRCLSLIPYEKAMGIYTKFGISYLEDRVIPIWSICKLWEILNQSKIDFAPHTLVIGAEELRDRVVDWVCRCIKHEYIDTNFLVSNKASKE